MEESEGEGSKETQQSNKRVVQWCLSTKERWRFVTVVDTLLLSITLLTDNVE
jgi:hypothetical protein